MKYIFSILFLSISTLISSERVQNIKPWGVFYVWNFKPRYDKSIEVHFGDSDCLLNTIQKSDPRFVPDKNFIESIANKKMQLSKLLPLVTEQARKKQINDARLLAYLLADKREILNQVLEGRCYE